MRHGSSTEDLRSRIVRLEAHVQRVEQLLEDLLDALDAESSSDPTENLGEA